MRKYSYCKKNQNNTKVYWDKLFSVIDANHMQLLSTENVAGLNWDVLKH